MIDSVEASAKAGLQQRGKGLPSREADLMGLGEGLPGGSGGPFSHGAVTQKESPPVGIAFHAQQEDYRTIHEEGQPFKTRTQEILVVNHVFSCPELNPNMAMQRIASGIIGVEEERGRIDTC